MSLIESHDTLRILLVEDDPLLQQLFEHFIKERYTLVGVVTTCQEAMTLYQTLEEKPDLIIIDCSVAKKNELAFSRELLSFDSSMKVLMLSDNTNFKQRVIIGNRVSIMQKPNHINDLLDELCYIG